MQRIRDIFRGKRAIFLIASITVVAVLAALGVISIITTHTPTSPQSTRTSLVQATVAITEGVTKSAFSHPAKMIPVKVTAYTLEGKMTDGKETHLGACAVSTAQFPLGSVIYLYNLDGTFNRQCVAEDTGPSIGYGDIDLAMPGDEAGAVHWGTRNLLAQVIRRGWG